MEFLIYRILELWSWDLGFVIYLNICEWDVFMVDLSYICGL